MAVAALAALLTTSQVLQVSSAPIYTCGNGIRGLVHDLNSKACHGRQLQATLGVVEQVDEKEALTPKYPISVCIEGDSQFFGDETEQIEGLPDGIWVYSNNKCYIEEFAAGFDGYWSNKAESAEPRLEAAVAQMIGGNSAAAAKFMMEMKRRAVIEKSEQIPDAIENEAALRDLRRSNRGKASEACTGMIKLTCEPNVQDSMMLNLAAGQETQAGTGQYEVCVEGDRQFFGLENPLNKYTSEKYPNAPEIQPDGIWVYADGTCMLEEWAGGYDGYWDVDASSGHEPGVSEALRQMLNGGDEKATEFLTRLRDLAQPENLVDGPEGDIIADSGERMKNIRKGSEACTDLLHVTTCNSSAAAVNVTSNAAACEETLAAARTEEFPLTEVPDSEKYQVCLSNSTQYFGLKDADGLPDPERHNKPDGIWVHENGTCVLDEYCGGFDGFWSTNSTDTHEIGVAEATRQMLGVANNTDGNAQASAFLKLMIGMAVPTDLDFDEPNQQILADCGERVRNIRKGSAACTSLIDVKMCGA